MIGRLFWVEGIKRCPKVGTHHTSDLPLFGEMRSYNRGLGITIKYPNSDQHRKRANDYFCRQTA